MDNDTQAGNNTHSFHFLCSERKEHTARSKSRSTKTKGLANKKVRTKYSEKR
jgi:hypothetical protein